MSIEVLNESGTPVDELALVRLARHVLDALRVNPLAELSVLLVDEGAMSELHEKWMDEPGPTDVLAFPMDELRPGHGPDDLPLEPGLLGDVVLCPPVAVRQAAGAGHTMDDELQLLCAHGILHLLGYDHGTAEEEAEMFGVQRDVLAAWAAHRGGAAG